LPAEAFAPATSRLLWLPFHLAVIATCTVAIASGWLPWALVPLASIAIGIGFGGITFLAHETLHGGVVRNKVAKKIVGWIGFAPFVVSPRLWCVWHNREHHAHANQPGLDPDMYPELSTYEQSRLVRLVTDGFSLGARRWTGVLSLMFGFSVQSAQILFAVRRWGWMSRREHTLAFVESALGVAMWTDGGDPGRPAGVPVRVRDAAGAGQLHRDGVHPHQPRAVSPLTPEGQRSCWSTRCR
jgi:fatty acid desaturase